MHWRSATIFLAKVVVAGGLFTPALAGVPDEIAVEDEGYGKGQRIFVVACDQLYCRPDRATPHLIEAADQKTPDGIQARARALEDDQATASQFDLVIYEKGKAGQPDARRSLSRRIVVSPVAGADAKEIATAAGASSFKIPEYAPAFVILKFAEPGDSLSKLDAVRALDGVASAKPLLGQRKDKRFIPDDPQFAWSLRYRDYQWHLKNSGQNGSITGLDTNVTPVWESYRGDGVTIAIVDDGLQVDHPDLAGNVNTAIDHDFNDGTPQDPTPPLQDLGNGHFWDHGTSVAGVAAGRGGNGIGITGAAPHAQLVGLKILTADTSEAEEAAALGWRTDVIDISNNSWGAPDDGQTLHTPGPLILSALARGVTLGRGGKGTIYVWSSGNGGATGDYANYDGFVNAVETIGVGAVNYRGVQAWYSESGSNVVVCAPSSNDIDDHGIVTTTLTTNQSYTTSFGGTSASAPLVSGIVALMLNANPDLGWRDVQEILIRSARQVDSRNLEWRTNGAGHHFHYGYGAGMIDAEAAVNMALSWQNLTAQQSNEASLGSLNFNIPDDQTSGVIKTFTLSGTDLRVEHVQLTVDISHSFRGDIEITLTSPSGMESKLSKEHLDINADYNNYTFLSVRHWGEMSNGQWKLKVADLSPEDTGKLVTASLRVLGTDPNTPTGYDAWAIEQFSGSSKTSAELADPDHDGRPNLVEYALNSNPILPKTGTGITTERLGDYARIRYVTDKSKSDITYVLKSSTDLSHWNSLPASVISTNGNLETREASIALELDIPQLFKLEITR
ncbi:MAG: subtilisin family serine protease/subtilisin-like proprotein convertase family protein [Verrucomicrobiales bacterium]|jgi:subtilisin family serine protease/subtilisin-like proprotein convertase family protein